MRRIPAEQLIASHACPLWRAHYDVVRFYANRALRLERQLRDVLACDGIDDRLRQRAIRAAGWHREVQP
jgi:hypothetical protein